MIAGDGIGAEVIPAAIRAIDAALAAYGQSVVWTEYDWGSEHYLRHGAMMPSNGIDTLSGHDAIFLGAVGLPEIPDVETLWGLLIPIRREFEQYVNLRPIQALPGAPSPVRGGDDIDLLVVRE
ncbi:MAG: isocitrate/isopropylmalate family dehydrogenase, partial [Microbacterium gubbeenense]